MSDIRNERKLVNRHYPLMVPGAVSKDGVLKVTAPYSGELIATVDTADEATVENALQTASALYKDRAAWLTIAERIEILDKTASKMTEQAELLALQVSREGGKPLIDARVEVKRAIDGVKLCIESLRSESGREIAMDLDAASTDRIAFTRKQPIGVVVAVSAFNHPLNLIVHQVAPAVASGCPVIVKPAEDTPLSCFTFVQILRESGLPDTWCQALTVSRLEVATKLVTDERVDFFSFIGSAGVGWKLRSKLAAGTRCALEHGGAAPVIITEKADLEDAMPLIAKGGFYHAGQVCVSVQRVFAHRHIAEKVAEELGRLASTLKIGDPCLETTEVGPLIRQHEVERVESWISEAIDTGAKLVAGGKRLSNSCFECTVLYDPPVDAKVSNKEIFGPLICVYPYDDLELAIEQANALPFAFQASVFTQDIDEAMYIGSRLHASAVMVNEHTAFRVDWMPFAGLRQSGLGTGGIPYTMEDMQINKMTLLRSKAIHH